MRLEEVVLLCATLTSAVNLAIQYYSQVATYPLFAELPEGVFAPYHHAYEKRLSLAVYLPFALVVLSGLALVVAHPTALGWGWPALMLALNLLIAPISIFLAVPTHIRLTEQGRHDAPGMRQLLWANALRVAVSALATGIGVWSIAVCWRG